jgi:hypothetical protein
VLLAGDRLLAWSAGWGGDGAHNRADEDKDSLILLLKVLTTVLGLMFEVGDSVFWIASVTSA